MKHLKSDTIPKLKVKPDVELKARLKENYWAGYKKKIFLFIWMGTLISNIKNACICFETKSIRDYLGYPQVSVSKNLCRKN